MRKFRGTRGHRSGQPHRHAQRSPREFAILYEDDSIVAVDKPAGMLAVPVEGSAIPSALSLLSAELKLKRQRAYVVHRIDRYTSGILLFAKTAFDRNQLVRQFLSHTPVRQYLAIVRGHLAAKQGQLVHYLRKEGMFQRLTHERDRGAARAELEYSVPRPLRGASLVQVRLLTGLQNQIRVQFSAIGHPVIGDRKYSPREASETRITRVALHASDLQLIHPRSGRSISIHSDPPSDFQSLLKSLSPPARTK
ncbi:MAG TPA: RluA family pseudouridine synthase [Terriglobales bacterium]|nr:RluA family pseudouridine synthase [Terriglobales bacterium]